MTGIWAAAAAVAIGAAQAGADASVDLEIGYMPIPPVAQLFVGLEQGWLTEAGITLELVQFQNGPAMVQAWLSGQLDVAYFGIGPAMVARVRGADIWLSPRTSSRRSPSWPSGIWRPILRRTGSVAQIL